MRRKHKKWTDSERLLLTVLVESGDHTNPEIAKIMGLGRNQVACEATRLGLKNTCYRKQRIVKHKHLRMPAMKYFVTHTFEETMERFGLTRSELRSIQTVSYRDPKYDHLRKDTRRNDSWSLDETLFLLRHAGLKPREWIAKKLNRGTMHSVKEMTSRLDIKSRYVNGLPQRLAEILLGYPVEGMKTKAGPTGGMRNGDFCYRIVPWVCLYPWARQSNVPDHLVLALGALSRFQKWIHGTRSMDATLEKIERILEV